MPPRRRPQQRSRRAPEVPRWRRTATSPQVRRGGPFWWRRDPGPPAYGWPGQGPGWTALSGRQARQLAASPATAAEHYAQLQQQVALAGVQAMGLAAQSAAVAGPAAVRQVRRRGFRFRRHLQPFAWLAGMLAAGLVLHAAHPGLFWVLIASVLAPGALCMAARRQHEDKRPVHTAWARRFTDAEAALAGLWLPFLAAAGTRAAPWALLTGLPFIALWVRHYRWRPAAGPAPEEGPAPDRDRETFAALAKAQRWNAHLTGREDLDGGGRRYGVQCDGISTVMKKILAAPDNVAGAWHKPATEVYAERDPGGITSRGSVTILPSNSLIAGRHWDGQGMDPATGLVRTGRFADGRDAHEKWYEPRYGCYHDLDSGTTGSGKSEMLNMKIFIALATGWFVPVILDPQVGQSLPFWQDRCIYAAGPDQVQRRIRGLHAGFQDRSAYLSTYRWSDDGVDMPGMPFFDYELLGGMLKIVLVILDEAHLVLKDDSKYNRAITADVVEMARLIRKAGGKMVLATQLPGLADLGGSQALRDMLRSGNVWSGRTANSVGQGMLGLAKDPSEIPRFFPDGSKTSGLGYTDGPDNRPDAPMRTDYVAKEAYRSPPPVPQLDDRFCEVMDRAMKEAVSPTSGTTVAGSPAPAAPAAGFMAPAADDPDADDSPAGKRARDAVLQVLQDSAGPLERGDIMAYVTILSETWSRAKSWSLKQIGNALHDLLAEGLIAQPGGKGTAYELVRDTPPEAGEDAA